MMIVKIMANLFLFTLRIALVITQIQSGNSMQVGFAIVGAIAVVTTATAWLMGDGDLSWRGLGVGVVYLMPLLLVSDGISLLFWVAFGIQIVCKGFLLHRCTVTAPVFVSVESDGPYAVVRHPMTATEGVMVLAMVSTNPTAWNVVFAILIIVAKVIIIEWEEQFLRSEREYRKYCDVVKFKVIPGVW